MLTRSTSASSRHIGDQESSVRRVAIFFWEGYVGIAPSVINGVRALAGAGYSIDLFLHNETSFPGIAFGPQVSVHSLPRTKSQPRPRHTLAARALDKCLRIFRRTFGIRETSRRSRSQCVEQIRFTVRCRRAVKGKRYQCAIGVDHAGVIAAGLFSLLARIPYYYWSLELEPLAPGCNIYDRLLKRLEIYCHKRARMTIIQDAARRDCLAQIHKIETGQYVLVPNGPGGCPVRTKSNILRQRLSIPSSQRLALHAGSISPPMLGLEMATAAAVWPENLTLVLHERIARDPGDLYLAQVKAAGGDRIALSLQPVSYDGLDELISSADIGIVAYSRAWGENFSLMAGASGKLAHYLKCGIPVVVVDCPAVAAVVEKWNCGLGVESADGMAAAIDRLLADYRTYSANAYRCFVEALHFTSAFAVVLDDIAQIREHST